MSRAARLLALLAVLVMESAIVPALAGEPPEAPASGPAQATSTSLKHAQRHACMSARLADMDREMAEHMAQFNRQYPLAQRWEVHLERHNFSDRQKVTHADEIALVRRECGYHHRPVQ